MRIAVLTDIHANREAFEAVLADVAAHGVDRIALLGDIVGYGADPGWCCDNAAELVAEGAICVRGNHDNAASGASEAMSTRSTGAGENTGATDVAFGRDVVGRGAPLGITSRVSNAIRLMSIRCHGEMLSDVTFPPQLPQPSVMLGSRSVENPIAPWVDGELTMTREAGIRSP